MYAKAGKNGCELLSAIRHSAKHYAVSYKARVVVVVGGGVRTWHSLWSGLSLWVGHLKKLWELKLLWPHGSFGMKMDSSCLIFTRILGSNDMGGEKMCITWLHWRIIKASSSKNSESVFPCSKSWASSWFFANRQMTLAHSKDQISLFSKEILLNECPMTWQKNLPLTCSSDPVDVGNLITNKQNKNKLKEQRFSPVRTEDKGPNCMGIISFYRETNKNFDFFLTDQSDID